MAGGNEWNPTDYEVGFRRPPRKSQFKKGRSGNPKGRPKGSTNFSTDLCRALREPVVISEHGKVKKITKSQAAAKQLANKAAAGDLDAIKLLPALTRLDAMPASELSPQEEAARMKRDSQKAQEILLGALKRYRERNKEPVQ